jgi:uncharacterized protein YxeA
MKLLLLTAILLTATLAFSQPKDYCDESKTIYEYDANGRLIRENTYDMGALTMYTLYEYKDTLLVKTVDYNTLGEKPERMYTNLYFYSSGVLSKHEIWSSEGKMLFSSEYTYTDGEISSEKSYYIFGGTELYNYIYDNNLLKIDKGSDNYTLKAYDDRGRLSKISYYSEGMPDSYETSEYDSSGRLASVKTFDINDGKETLRYETQYHYNADNKLEYTCSVNSRSCYRKLSNTTSPAAL